MKQEELFKSEPHNSGSVSRQNAGSKDRRDTGGGDGLFPFDTTAFVDYGGGRWTVLHGDTISVMGTPEFIGLEWAVGVDLIVGEDAHIQQPRTKKSLAQPMTDDEIATLMVNSSDRGVDIKCSHCKMTGRVHRLIDLPYYNSKKKTDQRDVEIFQEYFCNRRRSYICVRPLKRVSHPDGSLIDDINRVANAARSSWSHSGGNITADPLFLPDGDHVFKLMNRTGLGCPSTALLDCISSTCQSNDIDKTEIINALRRMCEKGKPVWSVVCVVVNAETGEEWNGDMSPRQIQDTFLSSSDKRRGGIPRSNLYKWFWQASVISESMKNRKCKCGSGMTKDKKTENKIKNNARWCASCETERSRILKLARHVHRCIIRFVVKVIRDPDWWESVKGDLTRAF